MRLALTGVACVLLLAACVAAGRNGQSRAPASSGATRAMDGVRMTSLEPPAQVSVAYAAASSRRLTLVTEWGALAELSAGASPFVRRVTATVRSEETPEGVRLVVERDRSVLSRDEAMRRTDDAGTLRATVLPDGRLLGIEAAIGAFDGTGAGRHLARLLEDRMHGRPPRPFRRFVVPAGPGDIGGRERTRAEQTSRAAATVALSPIVALLPGLPEGPLVEGGLLVLMRRDLGALFRHHPVLWTETRGRVAGMVRHRGRRAVVVVAEESSSVEAASDVRLETHGRGLLDVDSGFYLKIVLDHVLTVPGRESGETSFVVRERLMLE